MSPENPSNKKKSMKTIICMRLAVGTVALAFGVFAATTQAAPLIAAGSQISFVGGASLNGPISTATAFTDIFGPGGIGSDPMVLAGTQTGDYASVPNGTTAAFQVFTFDPVPTAPTPLSLWSFSAGATDYSFQIDAASMTVTKVSAAGAAFLVINGTGTAMISGYAPTPAKWSIGSTGAGAVPVLTFGAGGITLVPEPSAVAMLLALVPMAGLLVIRKYRRA